MPLPNASRTIPWSRRHSVSASILDRTDRVRRDPLNVMVEHVDWSVQVSDPTLAQLRPDLDALELAIAVAKGHEPDAAANTDDVTEKPVEEPEPVPEITLDREIQAKIDKAGQALVDRINKGR